MLTRYIQAAMKQAQYELLEDKTFYGSIPGFEGVWANESTLEVCRQELQEALEDWILLGVSLNRGGAFDAFASDPNTLSSPSN